MSALAKALLAELDNETLEALADALAPRLAAHLAPATAPRAWLNVEQAAGHLCCPKSRLYALVSAGRIPHCKDGSRLLFRSDELDDWVRAGGAKRP